MNNTIDKFETKLRTFNTYFLELGTSGTTKYWCVGILLHSVSIGLLQSKKTL